MRQFFFDCGTRDRVASSGLLFLRVTIGLMMLFGHGMGKIANFDMMKELMEAPLIWPFSALPKTFNLVLAIGAEVVAAALIVLGVATRPAAFMLGFAMVVAAFQAHAHDPLFLSGGAAKEPALLYLIPCMTLILTGAGLWSLDNPLSRERKSRRRRR